jgi:hypothetical protein
MHLTRQLIGVEDSFVKWNPGPTSVDLSAEAEGVVMHAAYSNSNHRSLPPPGQVRSHCCKLVLIEA